MSEPADAYDPTIEILKAVDFSYCAAIHNQFLYESNYIDFTFGWLTAILLASEIDSIFQSHIEECYWAAISIFT